MEVFLYLNQVTSKFERNAKSTLQKKHNAVASTQPQAGYGSAGEQPERFEAAVVMGGASNNNRGVTPLFNAIIAAKSVKRILYQQKKF